MTIKLGIIIADRYHILELIGEGGMAFVYKAHDLKIESGSEAEGDYFVAVKTLRTDKLIQESKERTIRRFVAEARNTARLKHPNIVQVSDTGTFEDIPYMVMEYLPGDSLKERKEHVMPWKKALTLVHPIVQALAYAHSKNIFHRDIKPANILLDEEGNPKLVDFGIAKVIETEQTQELTLTGAFIGTPSYMAPEQFTSKVYDFRVDIYSVGVVLYELITGRKPFEADSVAKVMIMHAHDPVPNPHEYVPDLPEDVVQLLYKVLAKDPKYRIGSMDELDRSIRQLLDLGGAPSETKSPIITDQVDETFDQYEGHHSKPGEKAVIPVEPEEQEQSPGWKRYIPIFVLGGLAILGLIFFLLKKPPASADENSGSGSQINPVASESGADDKSVPAAVIDQSCAIAYSSDRGGNVEIYTIKPYGGTPTRLTNLNAEVKQADWSPDGMKMVFVSDEDGDDEIMLMDANGASHTQLTANSSIDGMPSISPDGKKIIFQSRMEGDYEIFMMDLNGENLIQLTDNESNDQQPDWSPDGSQIVFVTNREGNNELYTMDANGDNQQRLLDSRSGSEGMPSWSPDGKTIAFHSDRDGDYEIYIIGIDGKGMTQLTDNRNIDREPAWSPDGSQIAFFSNRSGSNEIYIMDRSGKGQSRVTTNSSDSFHPAWSPFCIN